MTEQPDELEANRERIEASKRALVDLIAALKAARDAKERT